MTNRAALEALAARVEVLDEPILAVAELTTGQIERFAVIAIYPDRREGGGCKATVVSLHLTQRQADEAIAARNIAPVHLRTDCPFYGTGANIMTDREALEELALKVERMNSYGSCVVDVLCEIALFVPDKRYKAIRANNAGTKVIYTDHHGNEDPYWPKGWTIGVNRKATAAALRALAQENPNDGE